MNDFNADFGQLRSLLNRRHEAPTWQRICEVARTWSGDPVWAERAEPYAAHHLRAWPDALRVMPSAWIDMAIDGHEVPCASWFRRLSDVRRRFLEGDLDRILSRDELSSLTDLEFHYRSGVHELERSMERLGASLSRLVVDRVPYTTVFSRGAFLGPLVERGVQLRGLVLTGNGIGDEGLAHLVAGRGFPGLEELGLGANGVGVQGALALARASWMEGVRDLDLSSNRLEVEGVRALAESGACAGVERLKVGDRGGMRSLLGWSEPPARVGVLRELDLSTCPIDADMLRALLAGEMAGSLEVLRVRPDGPGTLEDGLDGARCVGTLKELEVMAATHDVLAELAGVEGWGALERLEVRGDGSVDAGAVRLARSEVFAGLRSLVVRCAPLGFEAASELVERAPDGLSVLDLRVRVGDELVDVMRSTSGFPRVTELVLSADRMSERGLRELISWEGSSALERLELYSWNQGGQRSQGFEVAARRLDVVRLAGGVASASGLGVMAGQAMWERLHTLELKLAAPLDEVAGALSSGVGMPALYGLTLGRQRLNGRGGRELAAFMGGVPVREVHMAGVAFEQDALEAVVGGLDGVEELDLRGVELDARATEVLSSSPTLERLARLDVDASMLEHSQVRQLLASPHLSGSVKCWMRHYSV